MRKILIVDDEPDMRLAIKNVLNLRGYEVLEAGDGSQALKIISRDNIDLALLDIRLPGMDGVEVLENIRKIDKNLPVVMITGYGHIRSAVDVMKLGANEYLQKPFENTRLVETVKKLLEEKSEPRVFPAKAKIKLSGVKAGLSVAILLAILLGMLGLYRKFHFYEKAYDIENSNVSAMAWRGGKLWVADWLEESVCVYGVSSGELKLEKTYNLKGNHVSSIALDAENGLMYLADSWTKNIQKRKLDEKLTLVEKYPLEREAISVFLLKDELWTLDTEFNLSARNTETMDIVSLVRLENKPDQIFREGDRLWSASSTDKKIYRHKAQEEGFGVEKVYYLRGFSGDFPLSALNWRGRRLWFAMDGESKVYEIGRGRLREK